MKLSAGQRTRVCLTCRTLFDEGEECRGRKHRTVSLKTSAGRGALDDEVWGPDSRARALRQAAKAGGAGGGLGAGLDWCNVLDGCGGGGDAAGAFLAIVVVIVAAALGALLFFILRALYRWIREKMEKPIATGALTAAPKPRAKAIAARGVVRGGQLLDTPWREGSAYGYALELHENRVMGGGAMMRDARSAGFTVTCEDGRSLRIPPGRMRVMTTLRRVESEAEKLKALVKDVEEVPDIDNRTLFPFDFARAVTIEEGDEVELLGDVEADPEAQAGGYRASGGGIVPNGVPYLRVKKKAARVRVDAPPSIAPHEPEDTEADSAADGDVAGERVAVRGERFGDR